MCSYLDLGNTAAEIISDWSEKDWIWIKVAGTDFSLCDIIVLFTLSRTIFTPFYYCSLISILFFWFSRSFPSSHSEIIRTTNDAQRMIYNLDLVLFLFLLHVLCCASLWSECHELHAISSVGASLHLFADD